MLDKKKTKLLAEVLLDNILPKEK